MNEKMKSYKWIVSNLVKAAVLIFALVLVTSLLLKIATRHNKEIAVPDFSGMDMVEARYTARKNDIRVEVTDSVFLSRLPRGAVFSQNPAAGSKVKKGRRIKLTINATQAKTVQMPDLVGLSLRQAIQDLATKGLSVGRISYQEDIATNSVLSQSCRGRKVAPGDEVEYESAIDLLLGRDPADSFTYVPYLLGYTLAIARENILDNSLNVGRVTYDETVSSWEDSLSAVVYKQSPYSSSTAPYLMGANVDIYLTMSQAKLFSAQKEAERQAAEPDEQAGEESQTEGRL